MNFSANPYLIEKELLELNDKCHRNYEILI